MAELAKVLLGDTTVEVVEKINAGLSKADQNEGNLTNLSDGLEDGSFEVAKATNAAQAEKDGAGNIITQHYATKDEVTEGLAAAGKVDDVQDSAGNSLVSNKIAKLPEIYTKAETDVLLGNFAGGMKYKGTLGASGTVASLPTTNVLSGDTYKVTTAGTYANQAAEVGDLFIATVNGSKITWTLVPSGDDGDVYADNNFGTSETIIVAGNGSTDGKKVKSSGVTISHTVLEDENTIPNGLAVYGAINSRAIRVIRSTASGWDFKSNNNGTTTCHYGGNFPLAFIGAYIGQQKIIVDEIQTFHATAGISFNISTAKVDIFRQSGFILAIFVPNANIIS